MAQKFDENWERSATAIPPFAEADQNLLVREIYAIAAKSVLEFGPGDSTEFMSRIGVTVNDKQQPLQVTTCEHVDKWLKVAKERFKDKPQIRVLRYHNTMPVTVEGLGDDEKFDLGFVDAPKGHPKLRVALPGYEDCSRFNTCLFALQRCRAVLLHDANRPLERGTLGRLSALGYDYHFLDGMTAVILHGDKVKVNGNEDRPDLPSPPQSGGASPGSDSISGRVSVNFGPDRLDAGGTGKKRHRVRKGRGQSGGRVRSTSGPHHSVEGSA